MSEKGAGALLGLFCVSGHRKRLLRACGRGCACCAVMPLSQIRCVLAGREAEQLEEEGGSWPALAHV